MSGIPQLEQRFVDVRGGIGDAQRELEQVGAVIARADEDDTGPIDVEMVVSTTSRASSSQPGGLPAAATAAPSSSRCTR